MIRDPETIVEACEKGQIRKILLIRISRVGDLLFTTPAVRCLHARFPQAEFHYLTNPYSADALAGNPYVRRVHLLDRKSLGWRLFRTGRALADLKEIGIDLVVPFRWRDEYLSLFKKIKAPYVHRPDGEIPDWGGHMADRILAGLVSLGVEPDGEGMEVFLSDDDDAAAAGFLETHGLDETPFFVFHAGCHQTMKPGNSAAKRTWPIGHWAELVGMVCDKTGKPPVLTGFSKGDIVGNDSIVRAAGLDAPLFTGMSLNSLAALLEASSGFVCGDTGPLHVASAVGVPTVALFGPSRPALTGPYKNRAKVLQKEIDCVPCKGKDVKCTDNVCMQQILPEEVFEALIEVSG